MRRHFLLASISSVLLAANTFAYGPNGHQMVGQIADEKLAGTVEGHIISEMIEGFTLEKAAVIPDEIKGWDKNGVDVPNPYPSYTKSPKVAAQLKDFWRANPPTHDETSPTPSHHWFHYTDVPVKNLTRYRDGGPGTSKWDIVHMIGFCVDVLQNKIPETNDRKITKPIAIILLCHYVGDIHQPLHVGAEFFTQGGQPADPEREKNTVPDQGGNTLQFRMLSDPVQGKLNHSKKLHGFWDGDAVDALLPPVYEGAPKEEKWSIQDPARRKIGQDMARREPKGWQLPANVPLNRAGYVWADEILPIAKEAHDRLVFTNVHPVTQDEGGPLATGEARERQMPDKKTYKDWSSEVARMEIHKAGWRLADLLKRAVSTSGNTASQPAPTAAASGAAPAVPEPAAPAPAAVESPAIPSLVPVAEATPAAAAIATPASPYGAFPTNYKEIINTWMAANAPQDAPYVQWQTTPAPSDLPTAGRHAYGYLVIFNSRSGIGGKVRSHSALIKDGRVLTVSGFGP